MNRKQIVVDAKGHLLGRLASYVAKQLELGQKISIVRCEQCLMGGKHFRNKLKFMEYLHKRTNTNPKWGPYHYKAPSRMVFKAVKGMVARKTKKGLAALGRLKCFDGCPVSLNQKKKMVIPDALKAVKLQTRAKFAVLGNIAKECGWTKQELVSNLEAKRMRKNREWYLKKIENSKKEKETLKNNKELEDVNKKLAEYGY